MAGAAFTDIASLSRLRGGDAQTDAKALPAVARQFESMFVDLMLKAARQATAVLSEGNPFESFETKLHGEMLDHQLAIDVSEQGGIGLAATIMRQLGGDPAPERPANVSLLDDVQRQRLRAARIDDVAQAPRVRRTRQGGEGNASASAIDFVRRVLPAVRRATAGTGIPPLAVLAQAALETGWGASIMGDGQGGSSNNLFGIKASSRWLGPQTTVSTMEVRDGVARRERAAFRVYDDVEHSVRDLVQMLTSQGRYAETRSARDPESYAEAVGRSGYATDPNYAAKLRAILSGDTLRGALRSVLQEQRAGAN